jgi:hypothetical protein
MIFHKIKSRSFCDMKMLPIKIAPVCGGLEGWRKAVGMKKNLKCNNKWINSNLYFIIRFDFFSSFPSLLGFEMRMRKLSQLIALLSFALISSAALKALLLCFSVSPLDT